MFNAGIRILALVIGVLFLSACAQNSQPKPREESEQLASDPHEEAPKAREKSLQTLRRELYSAQEIFFAKFNELNSDEKFDFECELVVDMATRRRSRVCLPNFARTNEAVMSGNIMLEKDLAARAPYARSGQQDQALLAKELLTLLSENTELREAQAAMAQANEAYQSALKEQ